MAKMYSIRYVVFMVALQNSELETSARLLSPAGVSPSALTSKTYGEKG